MELNDALIITLLGLAVVFVGLLLTFFMIHSFSSIPKLEQFVARLKMRKETSEDGTVKSATAPLEIVSMKPVEAEVLAVITSVLEVELRLRASLVEGKFTFNR